jgi:hypothetical protein
MIPSEEGRSSRYAHRHSIGPGHRSSSHGLDRQMRVRAPRRQSTGSDPKVSPQGRNSHNALPALVRAILIADE